MGTGKEVKLTDVLCATATKDPAKVTYTYNVASPKADHRYTYVALCKDAKKYEVSAGPLFWYDITTPSSTIHSGPPKVSSNSTVSFSISCQDNSFSLSTAPKVPFVRCFNWTRVVNTDTNALAKPLSMPASSSSSGMKVNQTYYFMAPGNYRFETYAVDEAGNIGAVKVWVWGISGPDGGVPDAAVLVDGGASADLLAAADVKAVQVDAKAAAADLATPVDKHAAGDVVTASKDQTGHDKGAGKKDFASLGEVGPGPDLQGGDLAGVGLVGSETGCDCRVDGGEEGAPAETLLLLALALACILGRYRRKGS